MTWRSHLAELTLLIFPELRPYLEDADKLAPPGTVYVVEKYRAASMGPKGWRNCNLRTQFERIIRKAGLESWPRLFHNLRASRETELAEQFPIQVVAVWLETRPISRSRRNGQSRAVRTGRKTQK